MKSYQAKHPNAKWEDVDKGEINKGVQVEISLELGTFFTDKAKRLAAKIAYESYCLEKGTEMIDGHEFDSVRQYIMKGILVDERVGSRNLLAIVGIFGLISYKVILSRYASPLATRQFFTVINPQKGEYKPILVTQLKVPNIHSRIPDAVRPGSIRS